MDKKIREMTNDLLAIKWLEEKAKMALRNLTDPKNLTNSSAKARAYAKGIPCMYATDTDSLLEMTLEEIALEWNIPDPVDLLSILVEYHINKHHKEKNKECTLR